MGISDTISLENDVFRAYAFWTAVVLVKMVLMSPMTIIHRLKNKTFCSPEDSMFHGPNLQPKFNDEDTERVRRAHRNDLENCIPFMIIGFLYVLTGPSSFVAINIIRVGAIARIIHTISYLAALQPWRAIAFFVCLGVTLYIYYSQKMGILDTISAENEVFRAYAFWTAVVVIKMIVMSPLTARQRMKNKTFANPEDASFADSKTKPKFGDEDVERVRRAHRNDLENCIPFMIVAFLYVLTDPSPFIAINVIRAGALARIAHTITYLNALQPWRALSFFVCLGATLYMAFQVLLFF